MNLVDEFVMDILLPHTAKLVPASELYDLFEKYCAHLESAVPHSAIGFGKVLSERLHKTRRNGRTFYYCEINPKVQADPND